MATVNGGVMAKRNAAIMDDKAHAGKSVASIMNSLLSREGFQKRFDELLGKRAPQFISSVVSLMNADTNLKQAFFDAPVTIIQSALQAASFDLPIAPGLGYAYIVPFRNGKKGIMEASFIMGYKGMVQLAMRTGAYKKLNVLDVREGELKSYDRLTETFEWEWIEDDEIREKTPIVGYVGYFQLVSGMEKTIYMTVKQLKAHELKYRHGKFMGKGWRDDPDAMMRKTVLRQLIGKWGIMSVTYQMQADPSMIKAAEAIATGKFDDEDRVIDQPADVQPADVEQPQEQQGEGLQMEPEEVHVVDKDTPFTAEEMGDK